MPNHVTNKIEFFGKQENINKVLELIKDEYGCISFDKIIPMPDYIYTGSLGREERELYGKNNWYDWSIANWGTKWNAYDSGFDEESNTMWFNTAWAAPIPVLCELAKLCGKHEVSFDGKWADEDKGYNVGVFVSDEDGGYYEYLGDCSNEAYEIYVELHGESECIGKDEDGNWVAYDCNDCPNREFC